MMMAIWWCVMVSALAPGGERAVNRQLATYDAQMRAQFDDVIERAPAMAARRPARSAAMRAALRPPRRSGVRALTRSAVPAMAR
jgi:hypothetical protein